MNVSSGAVAGLFDSRDGLAKLVEDVLNQILDVQATEALGMDTMSTPTSDVVYAMAIEPERCLRESGLLP